MPDATDRPEFEVKVAGAALDEADKARLVRVDVHEEVGRIARASVLFGNWDDSANAVALSDGDTLAPGKEIQILVGYGTPELIFDGLVTKLRCAFRTGGEPMLEVVCRCRGSLLATARRTRVVSEASDGALVDAIVGDYGLQADSETGAEQPFAVQADEPDWDILRDRAEALGYALYVRGKTLTFKPPATSGEPVLSLAWGRDVEEITLEQDPGSRLKQVTAAGWDPENLEATESEAGAGESTAPTGDRPTVEQALSDAGFPVREERIPSPAALAPDELDAIAHGEIEREAQGHISGRGRVLGNPKIRSDALLELTGCGSRFDGPHWISAARHTVERDGYTSEFQLGLPTPLPRPAAEARRERIAIGVVEDIDDPNGWCRVKVRLPWLSPDAEAIWARLALPAAGPERGFFFVPEPEDEVVVGFLDGDPRNPVVLGSLWNGQHAPPEELDAQTNAIREIVSRSGHKLVFDDSDGAEKVEVETSASQKLTIDDASGSEKIELADKSGNKVTLDSNGITLEAASGGEINLKSSSGKVAIDAGQLEGKASSSAKIESSASLDLQASAALGLKGGLVKIN